MSNVDYEMKMVVEEYTKTKNCVINITRHYHWNETPKKKKRISFWSIVTDDFVVVRQVGTFVKRSQPDVKRWHYIKVFNLFKGVKLVP